jgi:hypothetical protein
MTPLRAAAILACTAVIALPAPAAAEPPDRPTCARAYESAQRQRRIHALKGARESLLVCSRSECPGWMRKDCTPWLGEVEAALPTIVLVVHGEGGVTRTDVRLSVDGELVAERLPPEPIPIDPGAHVLVLEAQGAARLEEHLTLHEGERDRRVELTLVPKTEAPNAATKPVPPPPGDTQQEDDRPVPTLAWVLGGIGLVTLGAGTYFQISGMTKRSDLDACAPTCPTSQVSDARSVLWAGNVLLGVSVISLAAAAYVYITRPTAPASVGQR